MPKYVVTVEFVVEVGEGVDPDSIYLDLPAGYDGVPFTDGENDDIAVLEHNTIDVSVCDDADADDDADDADACFPRE